MKTDRELLELAAKAAGVTGVLVERMAADGYPCDFVGIGRSAATIAPLWNPRTNDGDAFRLAVKLNMTIGVEHEAQAVWFAGDELKELSEPLGDDPCAAMRRAIVRAAAEIGEAMP
jgi:hypothetical protein